MFGPGVVIRLALRFTFDKKGGSLVFGEAVVVSAPARPHQGSSIRADPRTPWSCLSINTSQHSLNE